jgi:hypothetical protein
VQPAAAEPVSRPTSANEPPKREGDSTLKELEKAKTDAENVKASEAMARKLADAEAALQRAKEEAGRATKEAEQAKAQAQGARESEAAVKHKLADAEAAKAKAEQACHSGDKARSGLGGRLRRWLGRPGTPNHWGPAARIGNYKVKGASLENGLLYPKLFSAADGIIR